MSTAAPSPLRPTNFQRSEIIETVQAFNAVIEAQRFLAPAELRLALILIKRGAQREDVSVSAKNWNEWTGLDKKSRDLAIRGLQKKGFSVSGRGDKTRFRFSANDWREYVSKADRTERPHVEQKRTPAKPGQMIHPECREQGCFLARQDESNLVSIDGARPTAALVESGVRDQVTPDSRKTAYCSSDDGMSPTPEGDCPEDVHAASINGRGAAPIVSGSLPSHSSGTSAANSRATNNKKTENGPCVQNQDSTTTSISTMTTTPTKCTTKGNPSTTKKKTTGTRATCADSISTNASATTTNPATISKSSTNQNRKENRGLPEQSRLSTRGESQGDRVPTSAVSPDEWPLTMTAMLQRFITAGADFLSRLVALVQSQFADVSDSELARAIGAATKRDQKSEALWLRTVPTCIENLRRRAVVELECPFSTIRSRTIECEDLPDSKKAVLRKRCALCRKEFQPKHPSDTICSAH